MVASGRWPALALSADSRNRSATTEMSILIDRHGPYGHRVPGDLDELPLGRDAQTRLAPLEAPDQGGAEMTPPLLMLDVDGVLLPFANAAHATP